MYQKNSEGIFDWTKGGLCETRTFAGTLELEPNRQLESKLDHLKKMAVNFGGVLAIQKDFSPHGFVWCVLKADDGGLWRQKYSGGLIYHGPHDNGGDGGGPTYSVNINGVTGWSVHT